MKMTNRLFFYSSHLDTNSIRRQCHQNTQAKSVHGNLRQSAVDKPTKEEEDLSLSRLRKGNWWSDSGSNGQLYVNNFQRGGLG